jgi:hypothetical protein
MSVRVFQHLLVLIAVAACNRGAAAPQRGAVSASIGSAAGTTGECRILSAADIKTITGAKVHLIARGASPGAGGTCGNYATLDNAAYLGVSVLQTASEYDMAVAAVPQDVYPKRRPVAGLGDQSVLMKDDTGILRYLVARKGNHGVVLFPLGRAGRQVSDAQLTQLAERAIRGGQPGR